MTIALTPVSVGADEMKAFLERFEDELPALSEHKQMRLGGGEDAILAAWSDVDGLAVVSVAAWHGGDRPHWALEVVTRVDLRRPDAERLAIATAAATVPAGEPHSLWAFRPDQIAAAQRLGYREVRSVVRMEGPFPAEERTGSVTIGGLEPGDDASLITVHNRAFAGHPEASGMTQQRLDELRSAPWFDPDGVVVARRAGAVVGYCWTKLHPNGDGEIYFLAVDPTDRGHRIGEALAAAGYRRLRDRGARRAILWVDGDNDAAVSLYRRIGLAPTVRNVELAPMAPG
jgi:mycothiol synthase